MSNVKTQISNLKFQKLFRTGLSCERSVNDKRLNPKSETRNSKQIRNSKFKIRNLKDEIRNLTDEIPASLLGGRDSKSEIRNSKFETNSKSEIRNSKSETNSKSQFPKSKIVFF